SRRLATLTEQRRRRSTRRIGSQARPRIPQAVCAKLTALRISQAKGSDHEYHDKPDADHRRDAAVGWRDGGRDGAGRWYRDGLSPRLHELCLLVPGPTSAG